MLTFIVQKIAQASSVTLALWPTTQSGQAYVVMVNGLVHTIFSILLRVPNTIREFDVQRRYTTVVVVGQVQVKCNLEDLHFVETPVVYRCFVCRKGSTLLDATALQ